MRKGIIVAGGTGGHIYPGIAIGKKLKALYKDINVLFVGRNKEMEKYIYRKENLEFRGINIRAKGVLFFIGFMESLFLIVRYKPDFVIGLGSYISFPMVFWAYLFGIPVFMQEQNVKPGVVTKISEGWVDKIFFGYGESSLFVKFKEKIKITGNPLRFKESRSPCKDKREILVFGGSLGAEKINNIVIKIVRYINENNIPFPYKFIMITGKKLYKNFAHYEDEKFLKIYAYVDDIEKYYKRAVLVIARAGALTVSEIAFFGIPAIFIPWSLAKKNHQKANAEFLVKSKQAVLIEDENLSVDLLWKEIYNILRDRKKLKSFHFNTFKFLFKDSAEKIAKFVIEFIK